MKPRWTEPHHVGPVSRPSGHRSWHRPRVKQGEHVPAPHFVGGVIYFQKGLGKGDAGREGKVSFRHHMYRRAPAHVGDGGVFRCCYKHSIGTGTL